MSELQKAAQNHRRQLARQLQTAEALSEPCPPGRWRWADLRYGGYECKSDDELAADRLRNQQEAVRLRGAIAELDAEWARQRSI